MSSIQLAELLWPNKEIKNYLKNKESLQIILKTIIQIL
jgi:hypothetical protein